MGIVRVKASIFDKPTEEELAELAALEDRPVDTSDLPECTPAELAEMRRQAIEHRKKVMFSLRLQKSTIAWWQRFIGDGYTTVMARLLEEATRNTDWIKKCL